MQERRPAIGLALIARDEATTLPRLLGSIAGAFDRVVLLDTGSLDDTVQVFSAWAREQTGMTFSVGHFEWCDDFAAARNAADQLLVAGRVGGVVKPDAGPMVDWRCWADCDDVIDGADQLRDLAANASADVVSLIFDYDYAQHPQTGECICTLRRERLVRVGASEWVGRVHEAQVVQGASAFVSPHIAIWRHRKQLDGEDAASASNERNVRLLRLWIADDPDNTRALNYLGAEIAMQGKHQEAVELWDRYLCLGSDWDDERAQVHRRMASSLIVLDQLGTAEAIALKALALLPNWPDSYLTLAEIALTRGEWDKAIAHAQRALDLGVPHTMLIINPLDYLCHPHRLMAGAYGGKGQWEQATESARRALALDPSDLALTQHARHFSAMTKRDHTADTYVLAAQQLVAHDEQLKALTLLEDCVPHFATDHPRVVAMRSQVRERLLWTRSPERFAEHYETGGSKPEDFIPDDKVAEVCERLSRVSFLLDGLAEQAREFDEQHQACTDSYSYIAPAPFGIVFASVGAPPYAGGGGS